jgi:hypothetical protein
MSDANPSSKNRPRDLGGLEWLRRHAEMQEKRQIDSRNRIVEYFHKFESFPPEQIQNQLLQVQFRHWQFALRQHPGYKIRDTLQALLRIKALLVQTIVQMHSHYDSFQELERIGKKHIDNHERDRIGDLVLRELLCFSALGLALVTTARRHESSRLELSDRIRAALETFFAKPVSHFVKCLRNNYQHVRLHPTQWEISTVFEPSRRLSARFFLDAAELLETGERWDLVTREFLGRDRRLDPHEIASDYTSGAIELVNTIEELNTNNPSPAVQHLNEVERRHDGWAACQQYKILLQPFEKRFDFDPYPFLPRFFSDDELRIIRSFPTHSQAQVDQMILIKDKWNMCDAELRNKLYKLFGVGQEQNAP